MLKEQNCQFSRNYSELEGLQEAHTVTYSLTEKYDGTFVKVECKTKAGKNSEACFLPDLSFNKAKDIAQLLIENSFELGSWLCVLEDLHIDYEVKNA